jgi:hypothetical protein
MSFISLCVRVRGVSSRRSLRRSLPPLHEEEEEEEEWAVDALSAATPPRECEEVGERGILIGEEDEAAEERRLRGCVFV